MLLIQHSDLSCLPTLMSIRCPDVRTDSCIVWNNNVHLYFVNMLTIYLTSVWINFCKYRHIECAPVPTRDGCLTFDMNKHFVTYRHITCSQPVVNMYKNIAIYIVMVFYTIYIAMFLNIFTNGLHKWYVCDK